MRSFLSCYSCARLVSVVTTNLQSDEWCAASLTMNIHCTQQYRNKPTSLHSNNQPMNEGMNKSNNIIISPAWSPPCLQISFDEKITNYLAFILLGNDCPADITLHTETVHSQCRGSHMITSCIAISWQLRGKNYSKFGKNFQGKYF